MRIEVVGEGVFWRRWGSLGILKVVRIVVG